MAMLFLQSVLLMCAIVLSLPLLKAFLWLTGLQPLLKAWFEARHQQPNAKLADSWSAVRPEFQRWLASTQRQKRPDGWNENHVLATFAVAIAAFLWWLVSKSPELPITELVGSRLLPLGIFFVTLMLVLMFFGGFRYQLVERLKSNVIALAIVTASIIIGAALVLGH